MVGKRLVNRTPTKEVKNEKVMQSPVCPGAGEAGASGGGAAISVATQMITKRILSKRRVLSD